MSQLTCGQVRKQFSAYLDGAVSGQAMHSIAQHLNDCGACSEEFAGWRSVQQNLAALGSAKAPADLGLKLRLAISHEKAKSSITWKERLELAWSNTVRPMALQAGAGLASTIVILGGVVAMLGAVTPSAQSVLADDNLGAYTEPHFRYAATQLQAFEAGQDAPLVVEALINAQGQVYDYHIVSGSPTPEMRLELQQRMLVSVFEPAKIFGTPVRSRMLITYSGISVRG